MTVVAKRSRDVNTIYPSSIVTLIAMPVVPFQRTVLLLISSPLLRRKYTASLQVQPLWLTLLLGP